jgi:hypothetical protein
MGSSTSRDKKPRVTLVAIPPNQPAQPTRNVFQAALNLEDDDKQTERYPVSSKRFGAYSELYDAVCASTCQATRDLVTEMGGLEKVKSNYAMWVDRLMNLAVVPVRTRNFRFFVFLVCEVSTFEKVFLPQEMC